MTGESAPRGKPIFAGLSLRHVLIVVSVCLFILGAFTAAGESIWGTSLWTWGFGGFAAWALSDAVS